ncbi:MAG: hypothetical protein M3Y75_03030 [Actinomycetota bacterium]|nr:hypothetical protein [Actinomycetota bacterium]
MKENRDSNFQERLLDELKTVVAQRGAEQEASAETAAHSPRWRRAPRLAVGAGAVFAAAAAMLVFNSGNDNTSKAFAVEPQDGGGVTITIYNPEDAAGLEGALAEAGIRSQVTWLPPGMTCREPRFAKSTVKSPLGGEFGEIGAAGPGEAMTIGFISSQEWEERRQKYLRGEISDAEYESPANILLDPESFRADQTLVIAGSRGPYDGDPEGGFEMRIGIAEGPVEPCESVEVPDGGFLGGINRASESSPGNK